MLRSKPTSIARASGRGTIVGVRDVFAILLCAALGACTRAAMFGDASTTTTDAAPEAAVSTSTTTPDAPATPDEAEDESPTDAAAAGPCPRPIHPDYCRHSCRTFASRKATKHASRMQTSERVGFGKCGNLDVFAEDEKGGDGGLRSGIAELFDQNGVLTGALDTRAVCGKFGVIPSCTPQIRWEESGHVSFRFGPVTATQLPPEVIVRIVQQNVGRFAVCARKAAIRPVGHVVAKMTIASDGSVSSVTDDGSTLSNADITSCMLDSLRLLSFPQPDGGTSTVHLPIDLAH